jgi:hypothetical protein
MNYTQLTAAIQDWSETAEASFVAHIPDFVQDAEKRIYNAVPTLSTRKNASGVCTINFPYLTVPTDWIAPLSLSYIDATGNYHWLENKEPDFIREAYPNPTTYAPPLHYALYDIVTIILGPTPDFGYSMEFNYFGYPVSIVTAGNTWIGDNFDPVLLYGSLVYAYTFQKGEQELITTYEKLFQDALAELKVLAEGKQTRDSFRSGRTRVQVP